MFPRRGFLQDFYVMDFVNGRIMEDTLLEDQSPEVLKMMDFIPKMMDLY